jgi:hypothetical protein
MTSSLGSTFAAFRMQWASYNILTPSLTHFRVSFSEMKNETDPYKCKAGQDDLFGKSRPRDIWIQIVISFALGLGAFLTFCVRLLDPSCYPSTNVSASFSAQGGKASTLPGRSKPDKRLHYPSFPMASLHGYYHYGG